MTDTEFNFQKGYAKIYRSIWFNRKEPLAKAKSDFAYIWVFMCTCANQKTHKLDMGQRTIAYFTKTSFQTVRSAIKRFKEWGYVKRVGNSYEILELEIYQRRALDYQHTKLTHQTNTLNHDGKSRKLTHQTNTPYQHTIIKNKRSEEEEEEKKKKEELSVGQAHRDLMLYFTNECIRVKGFKPRINGSVDGSALKRLLRDYKPDTLKDIILFFLNHKKSNDCGVTLSGALSVHTINLWLASQKKEEVPEWLRA